MKWIVDTKVNAFYVLDKNLVPIYTLYLLSGRGVADVQISTSRRIILLVESLMRYAVSQTLTNIT